MADTPIGVEVPIVMGNTGYFNQTFTSLDEAKANLYTLLVTRKGERVMQPEFGTTIYEYLFNQITRDIAGALESDIREAIETWLPYIELSNVDIDINNEDIDRNRISIKLKFGLKRNLNEYDEIIVTFDS